MNDPSNPFTSPRPSPSVTQGEISPNVRPTGVTVVIVLSLISGALGVLMSLLMTAQLFLGSWFSSSMTPKGTEGDAQREFQVAMDAVTQKFLIANTGILLVVFTLAICFIVGGIALQKSKPWARVWLRRSIVAMIVVEIVRQVLTVIIQIDMSPIMQDFFGQMASDVDDPGAQEMMKTIQSASMMMGLVFAIGWAALKIGVLLWGYFYLNRKNVRRYFDGQHV